MPIIDNTTKAAASSRPVAAGLQPSCLVHIYPTGPNMGHRYGLGTSPLVIGRDDTCDISVGESSVSRRHCQIQPVSDVYTVRDLQSTNGTFVNDRPIYAPCVLNDGDYLRAGNCIYRYLTGGNLEAEYHEEIYRLTVIDGLTQVFNRRYLNEFLDTEVARSLRHHRPLSVLLFDIDKFKAINDTHGHLCGDFVLQELAARLRNTVRKGDVLARYGGEEFSLVLVETPKDQAIEAAERIRSVVSSMPFRFESKSMPITVSVGVSSTLGEEGASPKRLLDEADHRLYRAKQTGRNKVIAEEA
jgi:two-component system, cell cycle response regulator